MRVTWLAEVRDLPARSETYLSCVGRCCCAAANTRATLRACIDHSVCVCSLVHAGDVCDLNCDCAAGETRKRLCCVVQRSVAPTLPNHGAIVVSCLGCLAARNHHAHTPVRFPGRRVLGTANSGRSMPRVRVCVLLFQAITSRLLSLTGSAPRARVASTWTMQPMGRHRVPANLKSKLHSLLLLSSVHRA